MRLIHGLAFALFIIIALPATSGWAASDEKSGASDTNFVHLNPILFPVLGNSGVQQFVSVTVALEFDDSTAASKAHALEPRLMDAYLQDLYGAKSIMRDGTLDPIALKSALEVSSQRVLGDVPCHVLLQKMGQRSLHDNDS